MKIEELTAVPRSRAEGEEGGGRHQGVIPAPGVRHRGVRQQGGASGFALRASRTCPAQPTSARRRPVAPPRRDKVESRCRCRGPAGGSREMQCGCPGLLHWIRTVRTPCGPARCACCASLRSRGTSATGNYHEIRSAAAASREGGGRAGRAGAPETVITLSARPRNVHSARSAVLSLPAKQWSEGAGAGGGHDRLAE